MWALLAGVAEEAGAAIASGAEAVGTGVANLGAGIVEGVDSAMTGNSLMGPSETMANTAGRMIGEGGANVVNKRTGNMYQGVKDAWSGAREMLNPQEGAKTAPIESGASTAQVDAASVGTGGGTKGFGQGLTSMFSGRSGQGMEAFKDGPTALAPNTNQI